MPLFGLAALTHWKNMEYDSIDAYFDYKRTVMSLINPVSYFFKMEEDRRFQGQPLIAVDKSPSAW